MAADLAVRPVTAVYLVVQSPPDEGAWAQAVREGITDVFDHFALNPAEGEDLQVSVTQIADTLYVNRALTPVSDAIALAAPIAALPGLEPGGCWQMLDHMIASDRERLRATGFTTTRPWVVLVVTSAALGALQCSVSATWPTPSGRTASAADADTPRLIVAHAEVAGLSADATFAPVLAPATVHRAADLAELSRLIPALVTTRTPSRLRAPVSPGAPEDDPAAGPPRGAA